MKIQDSHQTLWETMSQGILRLDHLGRIFQANPAAQAILGRPIEDMSGLTFLDPTWRCILPDGAPCQSRDLPEQNALRTGAPVHNVVVAFSTRFGTLIVGPISMPSRNSELKRKGHIRSSSPGRHHRQQAGGRSPPGK